MGKESALEYALEMVLICDEGGRIVYANQTARKLLDFENIYEYLITDIFPASFVIEDGRLCTRQALSHEAEYHMEAYRANKTCFPVEARIFKDQEDSGRYICAAVDLSEKNLLIKQGKQAQTDMEAALKVKSEFVANVTHELRTPVNGILGNTQSLMEIEDDKEKRRLLALVERGCSDMNAIINSILDFSKLEAGKFTLENRKFNFRNMISYVKSNHSKKITEKGLDFFVTVSPGIPEYVIGDELRIEQVLNNLLSNAYKFTSVGKISLEVVKTARVKNKVELFFIVIDSGIGIDKEGLDKLFQSFSQVDASISRKYGGTGLGLNISKQLVEMMGGGIRVESTPGKGSTFSFHIWLELPEEEWEDVEEKSDPEAEFYKLHELAAERDQTDNVRKFGESENLDEIRKKMSKLILSVEMENWEKAEMFSETLRQLTNEAPQPIKSAMLRLKMAVQKADYEKTNAAYEKAKTELENLS